MAIKKSKLESLWYYRVAKTIILLVPILLFLYGYGMGYINIGWIWTKEALQILSMNALLIGKVIGVIILYYVGISILWRLSLYIIFGGLENDTVPRVSLRTPNTTSAPSSINSNISGESIAERVISQQDKRSGEMILWFIFLICIIAIAIYGNTHSSFVPGVPNPSPKCIPTGCGSNWRCSGSYYSGEVRRSIVGCYADKTKVTNLPSWSGTCRRCP